MLRLDTTTRKLQIILAGAITTNQLPVLVCWSDKTVTTYSGGATPSNTNGGTAVDICAAPAVSTIRDIDSITVQNADTAVATVTIRYNDNGTTYTILKVTLSVGNQLVYTHGQGWKVLDANGGVISSASGWIIAAGKTGTLNNSLTLAGTDGTTMTFPSTSATIARTDAGNTFTGASTAIGWTINTPVINTAAHVGGTWVADATWTLPAFTMGGAISNPSNYAANFGTGTITGGAGTFSSTVKNTASSPILQLGPDTTSGNGNGRIFFNTSNSVKNWLISSNAISTAGSIEMTPSTAAGGTTFTTPVFTLTDTSLAITGALSTTGNVGINTTLSAWYSGAKALQFGSYSTLFESSSGGTGLAFNAYENGSGTYKRKQLEAVSFFNQVSGNSYWNIAASDAAGTAITWTVAMQLYADGGLVVGAPTGASKGAGSINAVTLWKNGTALDIVFEPDYQMATIDEMTAFYQTNKHLPTIPTAEVNDGGSTDLGGLTDRLWETVEVQARYISQLNTRLTQLESQLK